MNKWCDIFCSNKRSCDENCPLFGKYFYTLEEWVQAKKKLDELGEII